MGQMIASGLLALLFSLPSDEHIFGAQPKGEIGRRDQPFDPTCVQRAGRDTVMRTLL